MSQLQGILPIFRVNTERLVVYNSWNVALIFQFPIYFGTGGGSLPDTLATGSLFPNIIEREDEGWFYSISIRWWFQPILKTSVKLDRFPKWAWKRVFFNHHLVISHLILICNLSCLLSLYSSVCIFIPSCKYAHEQLFQEAGKQWNITSQASYTHEVWRNHCNRMVGRQAFPFWGPVNFQGLCYPSLPHTLLGSVFAPPKHLLFGCL